MRPIPDHPHARGDNAIIAGLGAIFLGSPPRAWGQLRCSTSENPYDRFTHTRVGTTISATKITTKLTVHPHARGDNKREEPRPSARAGSPPRAWGQPLRRPFRRSLPRFTPTQVGTTSRK